MSITIGPFRGEYAYLSNFSKHPILLPLAGENRRCQTAEHAYQASKCKFVRDVPYILDQPTPAAAKKAGRYVTLRDDWEDVKFYFMYNVVEAKFGQHHDIRKMLIETGDVQLIEKNNWGDRVWGMTMGTDGKWHGQNALGVILQLVRQKYRVESVIRGIVQETLNRLTKGEYHDNIAQK